MRMPLQGFRGLGRLKAASRDIKGIQGMQPDWCIDLTIQVPRGEEHVKQKNNILCYVPYNDTKYRGLHLFEF
ncbi:hypothetical protein X474_07645 [Dethiosulfatarculus sandiegensis]|uniref:Uncharacterized protein n=1 Tax=Dethiosulfatarculus sandiegensis TaxID=1429043 RepID=A0A0D2JFZ2_9BACT|nr:hypothetical protein X474_07645 [Dethiosulfatarculus sandiegensis]